MKTIKLEERETFWGVIALPKVPEKYIETIAHLAWGGPQLLCDYKGEFQRWFRRFAKRYPMLAFVRENSYGFVRVQYDGPYRYSKYCRDARENTACARANICQCGLTESIPLKEIEIEVNK